MDSIVTGGAGFIGSNLVDALLDRGERVAVVDNLSTGRRVNLEPALARGAQLHELDIRDGEALAALVAEHKPRTIYHLAAQIDVRRSVAEPGFDADVNVRGTINVLEAARTAEVGRVVYASTGGAIYGDADRIPSPEDEAIRPMAPYGQSKFAGEGFLELYRRLYDLSTVAMRFGNVYGPRQDPLGEAGVIAIFCGRLEAGDPPIVYGDGTQTRDYIYVSDVVGALLAAAGSDAGGAFNVGRGEETSVLDLLEAFGQLLGREIEAEFAPPRLGELDRSCLDPTRAREELGWKAQIAPLEGLKRTLETTALA
jgi:UDP-glucose 4-epimerase